MPIPFRKRKKRAPTAADQSRFKKSVPSYLFFKVLVTNRIFCFVFLAVHQPLIIQSRNRCSNGAGVKFSAARERKKRKTRSSMDRHIIGSLRFWRWQSTCQVGKNADLLLCDSRDRRRDFAFQAVFHTLCQRVLEATFDILFELK